MLLLADVWVVVVEYVGTVPTTLHDTGAALSHTWTDAPTAVCACRALRHTRSRDGGRAPCARDSVRAARGPPRPVVYEPAEDNIEQEDSSRAPARQPFPARRVAHHGRHLMACLLKLSMHVF